MIPEYKKDIYEAWAKLQPTSSPFPNEQSIKKQFASYKELIETHLTKDKNAKIIDLGCGYGFFLHTCKEMGYKHIEGIDAVQSFTDTAKEKFGLTSLLVGDFVEHLKSKKGTYDVITAFDVMEHIKKEDMVPVLRVIYEALKPGGMFLMRSPNAESLSGVYIMYSDLTHETMFTRMLIPEIFAIAGFKESAVFPSFVNSNPLMRLSQIALAKIFG